MWITKILLLNWYSSMKKRIRKIWIDFVRQILAIFDSLQIVQNSKFNNFLCYFFNAKIFLILYPPMKTPQPILPHSSFFFSFLGTGIMEYHEDLLLICITCYTPVGVFYNYIGRNFQRCDFYQFRHLWCIWNNNSTNWYPKLHLVR